MLNTFLRFELHRTSHIGFAWTLPKRLILEEHSRIGHLTLCKGLDLLHLKAHASIGPLNWISAYPSSSTEFFARDKDRKPQLLVGAHAAITSRHLIDCTSTVSVGDFSTVAGWRSQLLSHSIDLQLGRQTSRPITIGRYCFVGTACVLLGGSALPDYSVLGAQSLLNRRFLATHWLYAGTPSKPVKALPENSLYFVREVGVVH